MLPAGLGGISHLPGALWEPTAAQTSHSYLKLLQIPCQGSPNIKPVPYLKGMKRTKPPTGRAGLEQHFPPSLMLAGQRQLRSGYSLLVKALPPVVMMPCTPTTLPFGPHSLSCLCHREEAVKDTSRDGVLDKLSRLEQPDTQQRYPRDRNYHGKRFGESLSLGCRVGSDVEGLGKDEFTSQGLYSLLNCILTHILNSTQHMPCKPW